MWHINLSKVFKSNNDHRPDIENSIFAINSKSSDTPYNFIWNFLVSLQHNGTFRVNMMLVSHREQGNVVKCQLYKLVTKHKDSYDTNGTKQGLRKRQQVRIVSEC